MQWTARIGQRLKLRDLHILLSVVQRGSMAKAAAEIAISQPAVSKAIAIWSTRWGFVCWTAVVTALNQRPMAKRSSSAAW